MNPVTVEVKGQEVQAALAKLASRAGNPNPVLRAIGEGIVGRIKGRFATSTGPDGVRWASNARRTIEAAIEKKGGFGKRGINAKGMGVAMGKRPLIGETGDLRRQNFFEVVAGALLVGNSMAYAAPNQFGAKPHVIAPRNKKALAFDGLVLSKVDHPGIAARPFFPITPDGSLYPAERSAIMDELSAFILGV